MNMDYKQAEMLAYKVAVQLERSLEDSNLYDTKEMLAEVCSLQKRIAERKFRIAVVGEFNRGKSSLINVLLGKRILPEDVLATTATINRITYGAKPQAHLVMKDGKSNTESIPVDELASYVTKLTEESSQRAAEIQEAVVEYPTMLCYNDVDLIDTPGMNDAEEMNTVTVNRLENIDLTIVAVSALIPFGETEHKFVAQLLESPNICQIVFAITYIDMVRQTEREKLVSFLKERICQGVLSELNRKFDPSDRIFQKYHRIFDELKLYAVSSRDAMEALETGNMELYEKSGYTKFMTDLPDIILSGRSHLLVKNIASRLEAIIDAYFAKASQREEQLIGCEKQVKSMFAHTSIQNLTDELIPILSQELAGTEGESARIARALLGGLGSAAVFTPSAIQIAMLPVMQSEFKRVNDLYRGKQRSILKKMLVLLRKRLDLIFEGLLQGPIKSSWSFSQIQGNVSDWNSFCDELEQRYLNSEESEETYFGWNISPVNSVLNTPFNQSVLPGLIALSQESLADCNKRFRESVFRICEQMFAEMEQTVKNSEKQMLLIIQKQEKEANETAFHQMEWMKEQCGQICMA